jgi:hypothetical protein
MDIAMGIHKFLKRNVIPKYRASFSDTLRPVMENWPEPRPIRTAARTIAVAATSQTDDEPSPPQQQHRSTGVDSSVATADLLNELHDVGSQASAVVVTQDSAVGPDDDVTPHESPDLTPAAPPLEVANDLEDDSITQDERPLALLEAPHGGALVVPPAAQPPALPPPPAPTIVINHNAPTYLNYGTVNHGDVNNGTVNNTQFQGDTNFGIVNNTVMGGLNLGTVNQQQVNQQQTNNSLSFHSTSTNVILPSTATPVPIEARADGGTLQLPPPPRPRLQLRDPDRVPLTRGRQRQLLLELDQAPAESQAAQQQGDSQLPPPSAAPSSQRSKRVRDQHDVLEKSASSDTHDDTVVPEADPDSDLNEEDE